MQALPDPNQLLVGALAFLRVSAIMFALPIFGDAPTPVRARILASLALTIGMYPILPANWAPTFAADVITIGAYVVRELLIGVVIGFLARIAFDGILMASNVVAYQMGFGTSAMFLPEIGASTDAFTIFHRMVVMMIFLVLGMHHVWIQAIADSFRLIGGGAASPQGGLGILLIEQTAGIFVTALQLAAPILVALLFSMAALGLVARTVPQMNVFNMSFPVSFFLGLVIYTATIPFFPEWMKEHLEVGREGIFAALRLLRA